MFKWQCSDSLSLTHTSILQSITHLCSPSIVIQPISTQQPDSEGKEAEKEGYKEIEPISLASLGKRLILSAAPFSGCCLPDEKEMCTMAGEMCRVATARCSA